MRNLAFVAVLLIAPISSSAALATSVVELSPAELGKRADVIVHAKVVAQTVVDEARGPVTYTKLVVLDATKGAKAGEVLVVYQPGVADGVRVRWVDGAHRFKVGEEVLFYAVRFTHAGKAVVVAMAPGVGLTVVKR
jgi:hypothetical protein